MSKQGKRKNNLLNKFIDIDNNTLSKYLSEEISKYYVLKKSNELAKEILLKHNIIPSENINQYKYDRYEKLLELASLRNIEIPFTESDIEVTNIDIIFRINEFLYEEINWITEHNYLYDTYNCDVDNYPKSEIIDMIPDEHTYLSDKKIEEVIQKYEEIISIEFDSETKELYEEKRKEYLSRDLEKTYEEIIPIDQIPKMLIRRKEVK